MKRNSLGIKRRLARLLAGAALLAVLAGSLSACAPGGETTGGKLRIVTTIFPVYDWVRNVLGDNPAGAEVTMLLDNGVDLHSYQPTAQDIMLLSSCDLFVYVGGESDKRLSDALQGAAKETRVVLNLMEALGDALKEEELVEGMQSEAPEHEEDHAGDAVGHAGEAPDHPGDAHDHGDTEYDEHIWLSLRNAEVLVRQIADALGQADAAHKALYLQNAAEYAEKLRSLDGSYQAAVSNAPQHTLLFGDRFPFRYLTEDYGLSYYAAFVGCSAETEASFETVSFLARKVDELGLKAVITIEGTDHRLAQTIVQNTQTKDQQILVLDSMQSVTTKDVQNCASYLSIMEKNLAVLKEALK